MSFINIILAADEHNAIGRKNMLPWHLTSDLRHFRRLTHGEIVVMGRKTFESLGCKPLSNRRNIVLSRTMPAQPGIEVVRSKQELLRKYCTEELWIIGGAELYKAFMPKADYIYLTRVHTVIEDADAFCPDIATLPFTQLTCIRNKANGGIDDFDFDFITYKRK